MSRIPAVGKRRFVFGYILRRGDRNHAKTNGRVLIELWLEVFGFETWIMNL